MSCILFIGFVIVIGKLYSIERKFDEIHYELDEIFENELNER